ncbi:hypothetical protein BsIDN1_07950 [Bacillus safensis]|uniref:Uncharacterized protein n=1 Tax=Bacillus safensis TaxID=561879 RepID=A0A5S9M0P3_BACIA|nr:hypothetical protein BsIDN1_07950 [Bacillus safensis]
MATLEQLNDRVEKKELTLEQAQEQARLYLSGPKKMTTGRDINLKNQILSIKIKAI